MKIGDYVITHSVSGYPQLNGWTGIVSDFTPEGNVVFHKDTDHPGYPKGYRAVFEPYYVEHYFPSEANTLFKEPEHARISDK